MVSGRGLGHTGGTLDKLESIPGFSVDLRSSGSRRSSREVGCVPDRPDRARSRRPTSKLYALRDVTARWSRIPLIAASIMSKKLAEGIDGLVLDVKVGERRVHEDDEDARALARRWSRSARARASGSRACSPRWTRRSAARSATPRDRASRSRCCAAAGRPTLRELTLVLGAEMLVLGGVAKGDAAGAARIAKALEDGSALEVFRKLVEGWVKENEAVYLGDYAFDAIPQESREVVSWEKLEYALLQSQELGVPFRQEDHVRMKQGTQFKKRKLTEEEQDA